MDKFIPSLMDLEICNPNNLNTEVDTEYIREKELEQKSELAMVNREIQSKVVYTQKQKFNVPHIDDERKLRRISKHNESKSASCAHDTNFKPQIKKYDYGLRRNSYNHSDRYQNDGTYREDFRNNLGNDNKFGKSSCKEKFSERKNNTANLRSYEKNNPFVSLKGNHTQIQEYNMKIVNTIGDNSDCKSVSSMGDFEDKYNVNFKKSIANNRKDVKNTRKEKFYGYKYLVELSKKETLEIIVEIMKKDSPFNTYFNRSDLHDDWLFLILKIIKNVCLSEFNEAKKELLLRICKSELLYYISFYLGDVCTDKNKNTIENLNSFMEDLTEFYSSVICILPVVAFECNFKKLITKTEIALNNISLYLHVSKNDDVAQKLTALNGRLDDFEEIMEKKNLKVPKQSYLDKISDVPPPENFRELSLYPTHEDLMNKKLGFVRPNKIRGSYDCVEHYLDVQFRLLREDFIDPLRCGIKKFLNFKQEKNEKFKHKYENVRLYFNTKFEQVENSKSEVIGYVVNFDVNKKMKNFKWEHSKRFMYGSLLLFTNNNFDTFFYGTVLESNPNRLRNGRILVALTEDTEVINEMFTSSFLMVESEVFYEPYFLVMKLLKDLSEDSFPMKSYIIEGKSETILPKYLHELEHLNVLGHLVPIKHINENDFWPVPFSLGLDEYQYYAFKSALTRDFCVIQGPPGTGKTFIGLKIVEVLLKNIKLNRNEIKTPILVVCYTNHALDQFLEGILQYTKAIVRIGGQSRSEILKSYNLRGKINLLRSRDSIENKIHCLFNPLRNEIKQCRKNVEWFSQLKLNIEKPVGIVNHQNLIQVLIKYPMFHIKNDEELLKWLLDVDNDESEDNSDTELEFTHNLKDNDSIKDENMDDLSIEDEYEESSDTELEFTHNLKDNDSIKDENMDDLSIEDEYEESRCIINEDDIFILDISTNLSNIYCETIENLKHRCYKLIEIYENFKEYGRISVLEDYHRFYNRKQDLKKSIRICTKKYNMLKYYLENPKHDPDKVKLLLRKNIKTLPIESRWLIYWDWISQFRGLINNKMKNLEENCRSKMRQYEEYKQMEDLCIVKNADVIGMTTTGAARLQKLLNLLSPKIVIVEEAAEALEAHIVASLNRSCEHVILIGDHKQLKPSAAVYELSKNYNIDVSLFERMINNNMDCPVLKVQHRMGPEISCLITPSIYLDLFNDKSVYEYEPIKGVKRNVFFLKHNVWEKVTEETLSKKNVFEVEFMLEFCRYLVLQDYSPSKITILTTYTGQMFLFLERKKQYSLLKEVKCAVVDKYQGEENEIILLSLVRSNDEGKIGFLSIENRVCVALSRAKRGLFIIGNMDMLSQKSELWNEIKETLERQYSIGTAIELYCEKHDKITFVSNAEHFDQVREGGCDNNCGEQLECGHTCKSLCHVIDPKHVETKCWERCTRTCPRLHPCKQYCYEKCDDCKILVERTLNCGHEKNLPCYIDENRYLCDTEQEDISPLCKHKVLRKCHEKVEDAQCFTKCSDRLDCGHVCEQLCHKKYDPDHLFFICRKPCSKLNEDCSKNHFCQKLCFETCGKCSVMEMFTLNCGHQLNLRCSTDLTKIKCPKKCKNICHNCNMKCKKKCSDSCEPCLNKVTKIISECGHSICVKCSEEPTRKICNKKCESILPCGHKCQLKCCEPCSSKNCKELVKLNDINGLCGHNYIRCLCYQVENVYNMDRDEFLQYCDAPCDTLLECGDPCQGNCAKCWQGRLHRNCESRCGKTLICGHSCGYPCREICPPCIEKCGYQCKHSKCPKKCGVPCVPCMEFCNWKCKHTKCTRKCGELCNRKPCYKPCERRIKKCGHPCVGFCGEPCPPLCRICDNELTEILFGYEDEPDARFVLLEDCNHTIESKALDQYLSISPKGGEIVMKVCPLCKTPITKTLRFMNYVKQTYQHIIKIKGKIFGDNNLIRAGQCEMFVKYKEFMKIYEKMFLVRDLYDVVSFLRKTGNVLRLEKKKPLISEFTLRFLNFSYEVLMIIASRLQNLEMFPRSELETSNNLTESKKFVIKILNTVKFITDRITSNSGVNKQFMNDIYRELNRYQKMVDFCLVLKNPMYICKKSDSGVQKVQNDIVNILFGFKQFTDTEEKSIVNLFEKLQKQLEADKPLTQEEKKMIHLAMSKNFYNSTGHWFTCSNGHYYCITECGGAMQESKCPDCGEKIGGQNHMYVRTAKLASDMDGATRPAWNSQFEMGNYIF